MPRVYALSIERPTSREKASEKANEVSCEVEVQESRVTGRGMPRCRLKANKLENDGLFFYISI